MPTSINTSRMASMQDSSYLQPATQWTEDPINHILRVCLPGFQKDDLEVQVDKCGKLTIRGRRPLDDGSYMRLNKVFEVPKDSHIDKIRGKMEDASLSLLMPKKVTEKEATQKGAVSCENKQGFTFSLPTTQWTEDPNNHILRLCLPGFQKDEFQVQVDYSGKLKISCRRPICDGKYMRLEQVFDVPKDSCIDEIRWKFEDECLSLFMPKKVVTEKEATQNRLREEPQPAVCGKKEEAQTQEDQRNSSLKQEESIQNKQQKVGEGAQEPAAVQEGKTQEPAAVHEGEKLMDEKEGYSVQQTIPEKKPRSILVSDDKLEEYKKKVMAWKVKIEQELEVWLDYGLKDGLQETLNKNKKTIAAAAVAFSAGFYISRNLRSSGR